MAACRVARPLEQEMRIDSLTMRLISYLHSLVLGSVVNGVVLAGSTLSCPYISKGAPGFESRIASR